MNGKEILEAMSFVDEKYVADAEAAPKRRRIHWQGFAAAAACLAVVLIGVWNLNGREKAAAPVAEKSADISIYSGNDVMPMVGSAMGRSAAVPEVTLLVLSQQENILHCQVADPGTSSFETGTEITVLLPDEYTSPVSGRLLVSFSPGEDDNTVVALNWTQMEE